MLPSLLIFIVVLIASSCSEESLDTMPEQTQEQELQHNKTGQRSFPDKVEFIWKSGSKEEIKNKLLEDFKKPLSSYPLIDSSMASYKKNGLLYREGIDKPFTGRLIDKNRAGVTVLEVSFLDGQPHGQQIRRNDNGILAMDAFFEHGTLSGTKTQWWPNGLIKEEEYWPNGTYNGRCQWDEDGRLVREERVK